MHAGNEAPNPGFETGGRHHQKSTNRVINELTKKIDVLQFFFKINELIGK